MKSKKYLSLALSCMALSGTLLASELGETNRVKNIQIAESPVQGLSIENQFKRAVGNMHDFLCQTELFYSPLNCTLGILGIVPILNPEQKLDLQSFFQIEFNEDFFGYYKLVLEQYGLSYCEITGKASTTMLTSNAARLPVGGIAKKLMAKMSITHSDFDPKDAKLMAEQLNCLIERETTVTVESPFDGNSTLPGITGIVEQSMLEKNEYLLFSTLTASGKWYGKKENIAFRYSYTEAEQPRNVAGLKFEQSEYESLKIRYLLLEDGTELFKIHDMLIRYNETESKPITSEEIIRFEHESTEEKIKSITIPYVNMESKMDGVESIVKRLFPSLDPDKTGPLDANITQMPIHAKLELDNQGYKASAAVVVTGRPCTACIPQKVPLRDREIIINLPFSMILQLRVPSTDDIPGFYGQFGEKGYGLVEQP